MTLYVEVSPVLDESSGMNGSLGSCECGLRCSLRLALCAFASSTLY